MIVKCIANTGKALLQSSWHWPYYDENSKFRLEIGKNYTVHGIQFSDNKWRYIFAEQDDYYPDFFPVELFEIVDHSLPQMFHANLKIVKNEENQGSISAIFSYKEMALNEYHYEDIVIPDERDDADLNARETFYKRRDEINELEKERENRIKNFKI